MADRSKTTNQGSDARRREEGNSRPEQTDAQLLARLRRSTQPRTAAELDTTAKRLRSLADQGVVEAGTRRTGRAGRPAVLFTLNDAEAGRTGAASAVTIANDKDDEVQSEGWQ